MCLQPLTVRTHSTDENYDYGRTAGRHQFSPFNSYDIIDGCVGVRGMSVTRSPTLFMIIIEDCYCDRIHYYNNHASHLYECRM